MNETANSNDCRPFSSRPCLLALVLFLAAFVQTWNYGKTTGAGIDFYQFRAVALWKAKVPAANVYSATTRNEMAEAFYGHAMRPDATERERAAASCRRVLETYSSPLLYTFFLFFATGEFDGDFKLYGFVLLLSSALGIAAICRAFRYSWWTTWVAGALFCGCFAPLYSDIRVGNVNQIQLGMLGLYAWLQTRTDWRLRHVLCGLLLGFAVLFKPNLVYAVMLLSAMWVIKGNYRKALEAVVGMTVASVSAFVLAFALLGFAFEWVDWLQAVLCIPDQITSIQAGNVSQTRMLWDSTGIDISGGLAFLLCLVTCLFIYRNRHDCRRQGRGADDSTDDIIIIGIGCIIYLLSSRLVWFHYLVLVIPLVLFLFRPTSSEDTDMACRPWKNVLLAGAVILISQNPVSILFNGNEYWALAAQSVGLWALFGGALGELHRKARDRG